MLEVWRDLSSSCPEMNASGLQIPPLVESVFLSRLWPESAGSISRSPLHKKHFPTICTVAEKKKKGGIAGRDKTKGKLHTAGPSVPRNHHGKRHTQPHFLYQLQGWCPSHIYGKQQRLRYEPSFKKFERLEQLNESIRAKNVPETSVKKLDLFPGHRHLHHSKCRSWFHPHNQIINFHPNQNDHPERGSHYHNPQITPKQPLLYPLPIHLIHPNLWTHLRNCNNRKDKAAYVKKSNNHHRTKDKIPPPLQYWRGRVPSDTWAGR